MSLFQKIGDFVEKAPQRLEDGIEHATATIQGTLRLPGPCHADRRCVQVLSTRTVRRLLRSPLAPLTLHIERHDDPEEKAQDRVRTEINNSHRFKSFANQRQSNFVKWHIDGHDFFYAVSEMLDSARQVCSRCADATDVAHSRCR